jgi:prepilin-type N-terminal cleavage/methylation domain-containing protein/prepilin-type processing-associated H-X9-DG protein
MELNCRRGLTLVELLVVFAIIGVLIGLLLPAVQMARESARRSSCANNLRQAGVAAKLHLEAHGIFPTGGWGADWVGDPDAGFGPKQPGGWLYNVLPYVEQSSIREMGRGQTGTQKRAVLAQVMQIPLEVFACPSRRLPRAFSYNGPVMLKNVDPPAQVAKTDYVINRLLSYEKSEVIAAEIQLQKGLSNVILAGEKSLAQGSAAKGTAFGDQLSMYMGDCADIAREVSGTPTPDAAAGTGFGAAHPSICNFVFCDGSVRPIAFDQNIAP